MTIPPALVRQRIRAEFERHKYVEDPKVIDILVTKGRQDLQEVLNAWQQESHILGVLLKDKSREPKTFMQKFLEGEFQLSGVLGCTCYFDTNFNYRAG